jgi:hypothetical protein
MGRIYDEAIADINVKIKDRDFVDVEDWQAQVMRVAEMGAEYARKTSPIGTAAEHDAAPGTFQQSIITKRLPDRDGMPAAQIYSDAVNPRGHHYSIYTEYGSRGHKGAGTFAATAKYIQKQVNSGTLYE